MKEKGKEDLVKIKQEDCQTISGLQEDKQNKTHQRHVTCANIMHTLDSKSKSSEGH